MSISTINTNHKNQSVMTCSIKSIYRLLFLLVLTGLWSCVNQDLDEPPVGNLPSLEANSSIAELAALHTIGEDDRRIEENIIIKGTVIADDRSGNFFKSIVLQDGTGGITVRINTVGLYNFFPIGREVFVSCRGLYIGDYNGVVQINGSPDAALEELLISRHVFAGEDVGEVEPEKVSIQDLDESYVNTLIQLEEVQFITADTGVTYADVPNRQSLNRTLEDCNGNSIIVRSSGYADFANELTPGGKGALTAVYTVFGNTKQLLLRDLADVSHNGERCGTASGNEGLISIEEIRNLFDGGATQVPDERKIEGVVISDGENGNTDWRNIVLQDGNAGIVVRFSDPHSFTLGESVSIVISGQELSEFQGLLQISGIDNARAQSLGAGEPPQARTATIGEILANTEAWESTLVEVKGVTLSGNSVFSGAVTAADATGSTILFTRSGAAFADDPLPGGEVDLVAIVSQFKNDTQLLLRNAADVTGGNGSGGAEYLLNESFSGQTDRAAVALDNWTNTAPKGSRLWLAREFGGNLYAQASAYQDENPEMETWLISPELEINGKVTLSFESATAFHVHDGLSVWISQDFDGDNIETAGWTQLEAQLAGAGNDNYEWVASGDIDLSGYQGKAHIGFRYVGSGEENTSTFQLDNIRVVK